MKSYHNYISHIKQLSKELIETAAKLRDLSLNVVSEEDLLSLQGRQSEILIELEKADQEMQQYYGKQLENDYESFLEENLIKFQELNCEFIKNLNTSHGLIQFEIQRSEEDIDREFSFRKTQKL